MNKSYILLHIAVLLAGFTGVFGKLITLNEGLLVWYRVLLSSLILFLIVKFSKIILPKNFKNKLDIAKVGLLITVHWLFFYGSIKYANVSIGVVCFCLTSFFTAILKPIIRKERFRVSELLLSMLTLLGITLIFHFDTSYRLGIILGVISSFFAALHTIFNEGLTQKYNSITNNYYQMIGGALGLTVLLPVYSLFIPSDNFFPDFKDGLYLFLLALVCTVGLYVTVTEVLKKISAFTVNLTFNFEPVYTVILAFLFFGEGKEVNLSFYIGFSIILVSVFLQALITLKKKTR